MTDTSLKEFKDPSFHQPRNNETPTFTTKWDAAQKRKNGWAQLLKALR